MRYVCSNLDLAVAELLEGKVGEVPASIPLTAPPSPYIALASQVPWR